MAAGSAAYFRTSLLLWCLSLIGLLIFSCSMLYLRKDSEIMVLAVGREVLPSALDENSVNIDSIVSPKLTTVNNNSRDGQLAPGEVVPSMSMLEEEVDLAQQQPDATTTTNYDGRDNLTIPTSRISPQSIKIELDLAEARSAIREASNSMNYTYPVDSSTPFRLTYQNVYRNPRTFFQSHVEMMNRFKVWTYREGDPPLFHSSPTVNIYGIDGHFMDEIDGYHGSDNGGISKFRARHPNEAHAFFIPWSIVNVVEYIYKPTTKFITAQMDHVVIDYANLIAQKYKFWNRSLGADHFMLSCHDWAPGASGADPERFRNLIRAICNANTSEGFSPVRDVSIPEIKVPAVNLNPPNRGLRPSVRRTLAFFAGGEHGHVRKFLFQHWEEKDDEILVYKKYPGNQEDYFNMFGQSKFCLCPSGYEVASPRIVEAVHSECVPVIISDNFSAPFSDVLDWSQFSVYIPVAKIPEIKTILKGISLKKYLKLLNGVRSVKWHFTLNRPAKPFDMLHMSLHSIWLRRLNIRLPN